MQTGLKSLLHSARRISTWIKVAGFAMLIVLGFGAGHLSEERLIAFDPLLYVAGAKSLAAGSGYHLAELYGQPRITLYPPGQSVFLMSAWLGRPSFGEAASRMTLLMLLLGLMTAILAYKLGRELGLTESLAWILGGLVVTDPSWRYLAAGYYSEPFFTLCLLTAAYLANHVDSRSAGRLLAVGSALAVAFLTRTAGISVLGVALLWVILGSASIPVGRRTLILVPIFLALMGWRAWIATSASYVDVLQERLDQIGLNRFFSRALHEAVDVVTGAEWSHSLLHPVSILRSRDPFRGGYSALAISGVLRLVGMVLVVSWAIAAWKYRVRYRWLLVALAAYSLSIVLWPYDLGARGFQPVFWLLALGALLTVSEKCAARWRSGVSIFGIMLVTSSASVQFLETKAAFRAESKRLMEFESFVQKLRLTTQPDDPIGITPQSPLLNFAIRLPNPLISLDPIFLGMAPSRPVPRYWIRADGDAPTVTIRTGTGTSEILLRSENSRWFLNRFEPREKGMDREP